MKENNIKFERNMPPKEAMGIGGLDICKTWESTQNGLKEFTEFLNGLKNKKIKFKIDRTKYIQNTPPYKEIILDSARFTYEPVTFNLLLHFYGVDDCCWSVDLNERIFIYE